MAIFNDIPPELIIDIIKEIVPYNERKPSVGVNAAWTSLAEYLNSLKQPVRPNVEVEDPDSYVMVSIYADLLALRS